MDFSEQTLQKRFHELGRQVDAINAKAAPAREELRAAQAVAENANAAVRAINAKVKEAEAGLFEIKMERGRIAKFLNGKTGKPD